MGWLEARLAARKCARGERVKSWAEGAAARAEAGAAKEAADDAAAAGAKAGDGDPAAAAAAGIVDNDDKKPGGDGDGDGNGDGEGDGRLPNLPFDFWGGFVGYLGYELRAECGAPPPRHASPLPDAALFLADRVVAADHDTGDVYAMALVADSMAELDELTKGLSGAAAAVAAGMVELAAEEAEGEARAWLAATERAVLAMQSTEAAARALDGSCAAAGVPAMMALQAAQRLKAEDDEAANAANTEKEEEKLPSEAASFSLRRGRLRVPLNPPRFMGSRRLALVCLKPLATHQCPTDRIEHVYMSLSPPVSDRPH